MKAKAKEKSILNFGLKFSQHHQKTSSKTPESLSILSTKESWESNITMISSKAPRVAITIR